MSVSTSSLSDRVVKQTRPLDFSGQLQIVRQSERILGGATGGRAWRRTSLHGSKLVSHRSIICVARMQLCPRIKFKQWW
jgi:hypothetical protein